MELELHQLERPYAGLRIRPESGPGRVVAALLEQGQTSPVVVVPAGKARYVLIDGYRRVEALHLLGRDTVEAVVLPCAEPEALIFSYRRERQHRSALEEGWLLRELSERHGMSPLAMARALDRSVSWVSRRLALVKALPETVQALVRRGAIGAHAAMRSLVPLARANAKDSERLAQAIAGKNLSAREVAELTAAFCAGSTLTRQRLLGDPLLFLKARQAVRQPPPPGPAELLRNDFEALAAIARRAHRRLDEPTGPAAGRPEITRCFRQARIDFLKLSCRLRKERLDAGSGKTCGDPHPSRTGPRPPGDRPGAGGLPELGQVGDPVGISLGPAALAGGEGRAVPGRDPGASCQLQGEPGPGA